MSPEPAVRIDVKRLDEPLLGVGRHHGDGDEVVLGGHGPVQVGLTPSELRFFSPGLRTPPWRLGPWRLATILCREVEDIDALVAAYAGRVDALIWPGYMAWSGDNDTDDSVALALRLGVPVLQCNWPGSLNAPGQHRMGESRFTLADGTTAAVGPSGVGQVCWQLPLPQGD